MSVLESFIRTSNAAETEDQVFNCFSKAMRNLGFDAEAYFFLDTNLNPRDSHYKTSYSTVDKGVHDSYMERKLEPHNYVHHRAKTSGQIFSWYEKPKNMEIDPRFNDFMGDLYTSGLTEGFNVPIFGNGPQQLAFTNIAVYNGKINLESEEVQIARLMSYHLHERIKELFADVDQRPLLSAREKEVIQWVMVGKSDSVIADIMEISEHTVDTYLRRCYQKLGVSNRIAAVVKALSHGIVSP